MATKPGKFMRSLSMQVVAKKFRRMNSMAMHLEETAATVPHEKDEFDHLKIRDVRQFALGLVFVFSISVCTAMLNNVVKKTTVPGFRAPAFSLFVRSGYRILTFPAFLILHWIYDTIKAKLTNSSPQAMSGVFRDAMRLYGDRKVSFERFSCDVLLLATLTVVSQYSNFAPLFASVSTGCMAGLGSTSLVFVFIFSAIFLRIQVIATKVLGVFFFIAGMGLLVTVEVLYNPWPGWIQTIAIIVGAFLTAVYQLVFKIRIGGTTNLARISFSVSLFSAVTFVFTWPLVLVLRFTGMEEWDITDLPWEMLMRTSCTAWALVFLINLGVAWTNPFFTSFGFLMAVPFSYVFDKVWNNSTVSEMEIGGATLICIGFLVLVFGDVLSWSRIRSEWRTIRRNAALAKKNVGKTVQATADISKSGPQTELSAFRNAVLQAHRRGFSNPSHVPAGTVKAGKFRNFRNLSVVNP
ncbi:hypothetical protein BV898_12488 [Hypsibius exemplaris]|uniref:EamA domain-containing protein n=1 Tax=Hypsibius exemplaris TaxID=2072580 RepID=A0A1W0WDP1_HYPEX|nr:hypothetical protein BV898_12488 [Hypsibius exemplaris]